jgi:SNF2 family DNA or RNA helicase
MRTKADLRPYQQRAVTHFYEHPEVQAVMPMGAGKTAAALTAIHELMGDGEIRCAIVLAPKKVAQMVWPAETSEWAHLAGLKVQHVSGTPTKRMLQMSQQAHVYVIGVDNTKWLVDEILAGLPALHPLFDLLVIDESSRFKSPQSKRLRDLMGVRKNFRNIWGLTGTPRPNGYEDCFGPLKLLTNGRLWGKSFHRWREQRFQATDYNGYNWTIRPEWEARTLADINTVTFTMKPEEMPELPELTTIVHWVELPATARTAYKSMERRLLAALDNRTIAAVSAGVAAGKLSQMANGFVYGDGNEDAVTLHTEKSDMLTEMTATLDEHCLIAYEFVEDLRVLVDLYPGLPNLGAGVSDQLAAWRADAWNKGELPRLALHPASAGHGLNLQRGGNHIFWYGVPWSAELYDQTIKRFHRPGQTKRCFNHLILARDTIDEVKYARVVQKMGAQEAFKEYLRKV